MEFRVGEGREGEGRVWGGMGDIGYGRVGQGRVSGCGWPRRDWYLQGGVEKRHGVGKVE